MGISNFRKTQNLTIMQMRPGGSHLPVPIEKEVE